MANAALYDGQEGAGHAPQLTITFPILETTQAFDGSCWLASIRNEEALSYATRQNGMFSGPRVTVPSAGSVPAVRVPIGSKYALPAPDILQEQFGDGGADDLQRNFYDKFISLTPLGLLRYQFRQQSADIAHEANDNVNTRSKER